MTATQLLVWGGLRHLIADWWFQNDWQASNKGYPWSPTTPLETPWYTQRRGLRHPATYVHMAIHTLALWLIFPWYAALAIGAIHSLIDLRVALVWYRAVFGMDQGPVVVHVAIWQDQVLHLIVIAAFALALGQGF